MPDTPSTGAADVGFAEFVAALLVETLDSIVASHTGQEERLRALAAAAELTAEQVAGTAVTAAMVDAALAELFPDPTHATTVREGGPVPDDEALDELEVRLTPASSTDGLLTGTGVRRVRDGVALLLARRHLASVQEVSRRGLPRVHVEGGTLRAKLNFSTVRTSAAAVPEETSTDAADRPLAVRRDLASPVMSRTALATAIPLRPVVLDAIRDLRLVVRPPAAPVAGEPAERVDVFGEVEIRFRTEEG